MRAWPGQCGVRRVAAVAAQVARVSRRTGRGHRGRVIRPAAARWPGRRRAGSAAGCARRCRGAIPSAAPRRARRAAPARRRSATCSSCECSAEWADWYISAISERAREQVGQQLRQHLVAEHARQHDVEVGQQPRAAGDVGARHRLRARRAGGARSSAICASVMRAQSCRTIAASSIARTSNTWRASSTLGLATKAPRAGSSVTRRSRLSWLSAWRTSVRETLKMSAIFCSASLVPGISRRSTMARGDRLDDAPVVLAAGRRRGRTGAPSGAAAVRRVAVRSGHGFGRSGRLRVRSSVYTVCTGHGNQVLHALPRSPTPCHANQDVPMGHLSTHVLDTDERLPGGRHGASRCSAWTATAPHAAQALTLNADGRADGGRCSTPPAMAVGRYRLRVRRGAVFPRAWAWRCPSRPSSTTVQLDFGIADAARPLPRAAAGEPWSYSTYRGS